jgi:hypothetical protein
MNSRSGLILGVVAVLVGVFVFYYVRHQSTASMCRELQSHPLVYRLLRCRGP